MGTAACGLLPGPAHEFSVVASCGLLPRTTRPGPRLRTAFWSVAILPLRDTRQSWTWSASALDLDEHGAGAKSPGHACLPRMRASYGPKSGPKAGSRASSPGEQAAACDCQRKLVRWAGEQAAACDHRKTRALGSTREPGSTRELG